MASKELIERILKRPSIYREGGDEWINRKSVILARVLNASPLGEQSE